MIRGGKKTTHSFINSSVPQFKFRIKKAEWKEKQINKKQAAAFFFFSMLNVLSLTHNSICVQASTHTESQTQPHPQTNMGVIVHFLLFPLPNSETRAISAL